MRALHTAIISNPTSEISKRIAEAITVYLCDRVDIYLCTHFNNGFMHVMRLNSLKMIP
jgi:hypothetical protein